MLVLVVDEGVRIDYVFSIDQALTKLRRYATQVYTI